MKKMVVLSIAILAASSCSENSSIAGDSDSTASNGANQEEGIENEPGIAKNRGYTVEPRTYILHGVENGTTALFDPNYGLAKPDLSTVIQNVSTFSTHWGAGTFTPGTGGSPQFRTNRNDKIELQCSVNEGSALLTFGDIQSYYGGPIPFERNTFRTSGSPQKIGITIDFDAKSSVFLDGAGNPIPTGNGRMVRSIESGSDDFVCFDQAISPLLSDGRVQSSETVRPIVYYYCASGLNMKTMEYSAVRDVPPVRKNADGTILFEPVIESYRGGMDVGLCENVTAKE